MNDEAVLVGLGRCPDFGCLFGRSGAAVGLRAAWGRGGLNDTRRPMRGKCGGAGLWQVGAPSKGSHTFSVG
jgi:hypothetical protein